MKFEEYELKEDKFGFKFAKPSIMLGDDGYCMMCCNPTKFVEVFTEQHMCSDECVEHFYGSYSEYIRSIL